MTRKIELQTSWDPNDYVGICYTGLVSGVMKTIEANRGSAFPEYMGVQAYRFKNTINWRNTKTCVMP